MQQYLFIYFSHTLGIKSLTLVLLQKLYIILFSLMCSFLILILLQQVFQALLRKQ